MLAATCICSAAFSCPGTLQLYTCLASYEDLRAVRGCALPTLAWLSWLQGAGSLTSGVAGPSGGLGGTLSLQAPAVGAPTLAGTMKHLGGNQTELSIAVPDNKVHTSVVCWGIGGGLWRVCSKRCIIHGSGTREVVP